MFCTKCGLEIQEGWAVCPSCGKQVDENTYIYPDKKLDISGKIPDKENATCNTLFCFTGWRRTNRFLFKEIPTSVEIKGETIYVNSKLKKIDNYNFKVDEIDNFKFGYYPILFPIDFFRILIFGVCLFISYGLAIFAVLLSLWMTLSQHIVITLKDGKKIKIPISQKADAVDILRRFHYDSSEVNKIESEKIDDSKLRSREWFLTLVFLFIAGFTLALGVQMKSDRITYEKGIVSTETITLISRY